MKTGLVTLIGILAGICTTGSMLPQVIKTLRTRHTRDLSLLMYFFLTLGILLWFIYGLMIGDMLLVIANSFSLLLTATVLILKLKHG